MLKYLIFFTLILFIQNNELDEKKNYLLNINFLTTTIEDYTYKIKEFEQEVNNLKEEKTYSQIKPFKKQVKESGFVINENITLKVLINENEIENENEYKTLIKNFVFEQKIKKKEKILLDKIFKEKIQYSNNQWNKYDLLVSKEKKINTLSIFTKFDQKKYVTVIVETLEKISYPYGDFIVINKSTAPFPYNPFNNNYYLTQYIYAPLISDFIIYDLNYEIKNNFKKLLVKYYSILSYYVIAEAIPAPFLKPFE